mmetsp:Transcript_19192/g.41707  ORF Transcript_19192/g.41707 Transcript_19192/m.41707 type:complete len:231 (-) Transcript_19192:269-961(-)
MVMAPINCNFIIIIVTMSTRSRRTLESTKNSLSRVKIIVGKTCKGAIFLLVSLVVWDNTLLVSVSFIGHLFHYRTSIQISIETRKCRTRGFLCDVVCCLFAILFFLLCFPLFALLQFPFVRVGDKFFFPFVFVSGILFGLFPSISSFKDDIALPLSNFGSLEQITDVFAFLFVFFLLSLGLCRIHICLEGIVRSIVIVHTFIVYGCQIGLCPSSTSGLLFSNLFVDNFTP